MPGYHVDRPVETTEPAAATLPWESRFPPGFTVEDLAQFRRRPAQWRPSDHFLTGGGAISVQTEYTRSFQGKDAGVKPVQAYKEVPKQSVTVYQKRRGRATVPQTKIDNSKTISHLGEEEPKLANDFKKAESHVAVERKELPIISPTDQKTKDEMKDVEMKKRRRREQEEMKVEQDGKQSTEKKEEVIDLPAPLDRLPSRRPRSEMERRRDAAAPPPKPTADITDSHGVFLEARRTEMFRRPSSLTTGSELHQHANATDTHSHQWQYDLPPRPELTRRSTSLKMVGDMDTTTTNQALYPEHPYRARRHSKRVATVLKVEGNMEKTTENQDKFIAYPVTGRPGLLRRHSCLRLEGNLVIKPETYEIFKTYPPIERTSAFKRDDQLKMEGGVSTKTETGSQFVNVSCMSERPDAVRRESNIRRDGLFQESPPNRPVFKAFPGEKRHAVRGGGNWRPVEERPMNGGQFGSRDNLDQRDVVRNGGENVKENVKPQESFVEKKAVVPETVAPVVEKIVEKKQVIVEKVERAEQVENVPPKEVTPEVNGGFRERLMPAEKRKTEDPIKYTKSRHGSEDNIASQMEHLKYDKSKEINRAYQEHFVDIKRGLRRNEEIYKSEVNLRDQSVNRKKSQMRLPESRLQKPDPIAMVRKPPVKKSVANRPQTQMKLEGRIETNPEYKSSYVDFHPERPILKKPSNQIRHEEPVKAPPVLPDQTEQYETSDLDECVRRHSFQPLDNDIDFNHTYRREYVDYSLNESLGGRRRRKRPEDQPETDSDVRNVDSENQTTDSKEVDANVGGNFKAFEVIDKKRGEGRQRGRQMEAGSVSRTRSPSPSYRLLVHRADEKGGAGRPSRGRFRGRTPSPVGDGVGSAGSGSAQKSVTPLASPTCPHSPLPHSPLPRQPPLVAPKPSFFVLDNNNNNNNSNNIDDNACSGNDIMIYDVTAKNYLDIPNQSQSVARKEDTNWMPPWYESHSAT